MAQISFILSSLNRSGGSRVTVDMGNLLLKKGYKVRIIARKSVFSFKKYVRTSYLKLSGASFYNWGRDFEGEILLFENHPDEITYDSDEIVIGVGTEGARLCREIKQAVKKVRFCHGFAADKPELMKEVWGGGGMETITVSATHVPSLDKYSGTKTLGVVPNGINLDLYYQMQLERDGIGMVYGTHFNKDPEFVREVLISVMEKWPEIPLYVFGESKRPSWLPSRYYYRYPSIDKARELYSRSLIWLVPSRSEGLPGPPLEAMACGAVVISTDNLGSLEIINDNQNGLIVPVGKMEAFMSAIYLLLADDGKRGELSSKGFETVEYFSWDRAVSCMTDILEKIRSNKSSI